MYLNVVSPADSWRDSIAGDAVVRTHVSALYMEQFQTLPFVALHCWNKLHYYIFWRGEASQGIYYFIK